jgi:hypothetical protein
MVLYTRYLPQPAWQVHVGASWSTDLIEVTIPVGLVLEPLPKVADSFVGTGSSAGGVVCCAGVAGLLVSVGTAPPSWVPPPVMSGLPGKAVVAALPPS